MPKTVLIVEDDEDARSIYRSALEARGYRVLTASHGAEGVHLARRNSPDVILLDIRMPVMNGWGAAHYLKADPETRNIPLCGISAYELDDGEHSQATRMKHFDHFLTKAIDPTAVADRIEALIGPSGGGDQRASTPTPQ